MGKHLKMFVDRDKKILIPQDMNLFHFILEDFSNGEEVVVTIEKFVRERTIGQNGLFHKYVSIVAKETGNTTEDIKTHVKKHYGARTEQGDLKSTRDYTTVEMKRLIEGIHLFANQELGLELPNPEEFKNKNYK